jgi:hypothetical protein
VDKDSIKYKVDPGNEKYRHGTVWFTVKKGKSFDLKALHDSLIKTRLGRGTRSGVNYLEITAAGKVVPGKKETVLEVTGTKQQFVLAEDPKAKPQGDKKTAYQRLQQAVKNGQKVVSVTGRVQSWNGVWPKVLSDLKGEMEGKKTPVLLVADFEVAKR